MFKMLKKSEPHIFDKTEVEFFEKNNLLQKLGLRYRMSGANFSATPIILKFALKYGDDL